MLALIAAVNLLCLSQLMKPQATVTGNLVSKDGNGRAAAAASANTTAQKGTHFPHRVGTFGANSDPSTAPPDLAAYCTVGPLVIYLDAYCSYFLGTVMWEDVLLEDLGVGVGVPSTVWLYPLLWSRCQGRALGHLTPLHRTTSSMLEMVLASLPFVSEL